MSLRLSKVGLVAGVDALTQRIQKKVNNDDESHDCHACLTPKKSIHK